MDSLFKKLDKPAILLALAATFILMNLLLNILMPKGLALDLRFAYSANEAYAALENMGEKLREQYLIVIWTVDMPYILVYFLLLTGIFRKLLTGKNILILPLVVAMLDLMENLLVSGLILSFPTEHIFLGYLASFFTSSKWLFVGACLVYILLGLLRKYLPKSPGDLDLKG
ncbi:hypothetical protein [Algoriphagus chordae]|uniref:Uncharacterized protein n=1 Tax=Algoriphagus chordae TaxID=237019 RepID=A0A2W7R5J8_9BACT|nr:hypothetical protein [Algoriphagus chordae]PZX55754.1 hypothetical protein LV85_00979 [Algoriphagus chordae]